MIRPGPIYVGPPNPWRILDALAGELRLLPDRTEEEEAALVEAGNILSLPIISSTICQDTITWIQQLLHNRAPPGTYFGTHPDNPDWIGYWPLKEETP